MENLTVSKRHVESRVRVTERRWILVALTSVGVIKPEKTGRKNHRQIHSAYKNVYFFLIHIERYSAVKGRKQFSILWMLQMVRMGLDFFWFDLKKIY